MLPTSCVTGSAEHPRLNRFFAAQPARGWGGKLFERVVHCTFRKGIRFDTDLWTMECLLNGCRLRRANAKQGLISTRYLSKPIMSLTKWATSFASYFIFLSSTAETTDVVYLFKDVTVFFQITISPSHRLSTCFCKEKDSSFLIMTQLANLTDVTVNRS